MFIYSFFDINVILTVSFQKFSYKIIIIINILYVFLFLKTLIPFYNLIFYLFINIIRVTFKYK